MKASEVLDIIMDISLSICDSFDEKEVTHEQKYLVYCSGMQAAILALTQVDKINNLERSNDHKV